LEEYDILDIIKVLVAANELGLHELIPYLESFLIEKKTNWKEQNFYLVYQISFENDSFLKLQKYCKDLISKEPNKIFNSQYFSSIPENLLITLIQNDDLQMSEIQVWEYVVKWGHAQNPELPSDPTRFSKDDFNTLKNTLQKCIPFIRFHNLAPKEFSKRVLPYKKILPKELYKDLLEYFLNNDSKKPVPRIIKENKKIHPKKVDSLIITVQDAELISKWIDRLEVTDELTASYEFKLLYRESRDGPSGEQNNELRELCKNRSRTITVIKVKNSGEIFGGYNPIEWKFDNSYGITKDSFIFSFSNTSIKKYILSRVKNEERAIYYGSTFLSFGNDLCLWLNVSSDLVIGLNKNSYEEHIGGNLNLRFVEDFEVFQIA
jgi:hypothetical protein